MSKFVLGLLIGLLINIRIVKRPPTTKPMTEREFTAKHYPTMLNPDITRAQFDELVEQTYQIIKRSDVRMPKRKLRADMLQRFANLHGVTPKQAEKLLLDR